MKCTLCNTDLYTKIDGVYFMCDTCGAYVKNSKYYLSSKKEKERYKEHENDINDVGYQNFTSPITNAILEKQHKTQLGLDYGCGTGPVIAKQLIDKGFQVKLYDPFFKPKEDYINYYYDYIFSCEVFEHFHSPKQEIEKLLSLLKPEARLYVMTHIYNTKIDFSTWYYRNDPTHVFIYTAKTIEFIAKTYNLAIEELTDRLVIVKKLG